MNSWMIFGVAYLAMWSVSFVLNLYAKMNKPMTRPTDREVMRLMSQAFWAGALWPAHTVVLLLILMFGFTVKDKE